MQQEQFQAEIIHALCDHVQVCCGDAQLTFDQLLCRQSVTQKFVVPLSDTALSYDAGAAGRCISDIAQQAGACQDPDVTRCFTAFVGSQPPGAPCATDFDCAPGPNGFSVCGSGLCIQPRRGVMGELCSYSCTEGSGPPQCHNIFNGIAALTQSACHSTDGLVCVQASNGTATCQPIAADCRHSDMNPCPGGQACDKSSGRCFVPVPIGQSCTMAPCAPDAYCAGGVICYPLKGNAVECASDEECATGRCYRSFCAVSSPAAKHFCGGPISQ